MRIIIHLFPAHTSTTREQRLVCFVNQNNNSETQFPKADATETPENADALQPVNANPEALSDELLKKTEIEKAARAAKVEAAGEDIKKAETDYRKLSTKEKSEQDAYVRGGEFAVNLLPYSNKTNLAYQKYRLIPDEETQRGMVSAAEAEERHILANSKDWKDGSDSLKERNATNRLAAISEMKSMNWERRVEKLEWEARNRRETEKAHVQYEADLTGLLAQAKQSRYPLDSKVTDFVTDALKYMNNTRDAWRRCDTPEGKNPDLFLTFQQAAKAALAVEQSFIEMHYADWNNSIIEQVVRNRHAQLGGKDVPNRNYEFDRANVREGGIPTRDKSIREWLKVQDKVRKYPEGTSTKRFVGKDGKPRPVNLSDLSDADRSRYLSSEAYGRGKLTQDAFDDTYFSTPRKSGRDSPQRMKDKMYPEVNKAVETAMSSLFPAPDPIEGPISTSAMSILDAWNAVNAEIKNEEPIEQFLFKELFLKELNRRMPDRVCAVQSVLTGNKHTFTLKDDDGALRMYGIEDGVLKNMNMESMQPPSPADKDNRPLAANPAGAILWGLPVGLVAVGGLGVVNPSASSEPGTEDSVEGDRESTSTPKTPEEAREEARREVERVAQDALDAVDEKDKDKKIAELMMNRGASIDDKGVVTIPKDTTTLIMNKFGGMAMKAMEFFAKLGEMWNKAFGKVTGAPVATSAATPSNAVDGKIKDKAEFLKEAEILLETSNEAKSDADLYKLALGEEKRILSLPDLAKYHELLHIDRLKEIDSELEKLGKVTSKPANPPPKPDEKAIYIPKGDAWEKDPENPTDTHEYKKGKDNLTYRKDGNVIEVRVNDKWIDAAEHAGIKDPLMKQRYDTVLIQGGDKKWVRLSAFGWHFSIDLAHKQLISSDWTGHQEYYKPGPPGLWWNRETSYKPTA